MFTGLIETTGVVARVSGRNGGIELEIRTDTPFQLAQGQSVAVSGACLTVERCSDCRFVVFASPETLGRTTLGSVGVGARVNLERALRLCDRFDGHLVLGHVDGVGLVYSRVSRGEALELHIRPECPIMPLVAEKGSIAVDGVSLTVASVFEDGFSVVLIPETTSRTTLGSLAVGDRVNLEADVLARYVARILSADGKDQGITEQKLRELGFWR